MKGQGYGYSRYAFLLTPLSPLIYIDRWKNYILLSDTNNFEIEGENIWKNISFRFVNA